MKKSLDVLSTEEFMSGLKRISRTAVSLLAVVLVLSPLSAPAQDYVYGWTNRIGGASYDYGQEICVDANGNQYLTGSFQGTVNFAADFGGSDSKSSSGYSDIFVTRINADGSYGWTRRMGAALYDLGLDVSVDAGGNVFVIGSFNSTVDFAADFGGSDSKTSAGGYDVFVTRINADGSYGWTRRIGGTASENGSAVSVDATGKLTVTGYFGGTVNFAADFAGSDSKTSAGNYDIFVTRINANGSYGWTRKMGGIDYDYGRDLAVDPSGNAFVTGNFYGSVNFAADFAGSDNKTSAGDADIFVTRINANGSYGWTRRMGGTGADMGFGVSWDQGGNIFATGQFNGTVNFAADFAGTDNVVSAGGADVFVTRISASGSYGWTRRAGGANDDVGSCIYVDGGGNVFVAGRFRDGVNFAADFGGSDNKTSAGQNDIFVTRINSDQSYGWTRRMGGTDSDYGTGVFVDAIGDVFVTGVFNLTVNFADDFGGSDSKDSAGLDDIFLTTILVDTDGDGIVDVDEINIYGTNPLLVDTDGDGLDDFWEVTHISCVDPLTGDSTADPDEDGLSNLGELNYGADPCDPDTDGDGMEDGWEVIYISCVDPLAGDSTADPDSDGLSNLGEFSAVTDPCEPDTDGDGFSDGNEVNIFLTDPLVQNPDSDSDGLPDAVETNTGAYNGPSDTGTDPGNPDTDGDGVTDGREVLSGSHPLDDRITPGFSKVGPDTRLTANASYSRNPSLVWAGSEFGVSWEDYRDGNDEIYFTRISAGGTEIGDDVRLTANASSSYNPSLAFSGSEYGVSWEDHRDGNDEIYFTRISAGGTEIGDDLRITASSGLSNYPSLAWGNSEYGVSWEDYRDGNFRIYFTRVSTDGTEIGDDVRLTANFSSSHYPSLAWGNSEFGVSWEDYRNGNDEIYFTRISQGGTEIGDDVRLTANSSLSDIPSLAFSGSEFGVSWKDYRDGNSEIYFTRVSTGGTEIGDDLRITATSHLSTYPSLAWSGSEFGVSWQDYRDGDPEIYFTRVSAGGTEIEDDFRLTFSGEAVSVSMAWSGSEFGVSWQDYRDGNSEIYFARIGFDMDGDGLPGPVESSLATDPEDWDTDDDGLPDGYEVSYSGCAGLDPLSGADALLDADTDGLTNLEEYNADTDPCNPDTDGDGLADGVEGNTVGTDPLVSDTDSDGMDDGWEYDYTLCPGIDPLIAGDSLADGDTDGLTNREENVAGASPCSADTDSDGMDDQWEYNYTACPGTDPLIAGDSLADGDTDGLTDREENGAGTSPCNADTDSDGMDDGWEVFYPCLAAPTADGDQDPDGDYWTSLEEYGYSTDPCVMDDLDSDGMADGWEDMYDCVDSNNPDELLDFDGDSVNNLDEFNLGADPCDPDTDADGLSDGDEVIIHGTDPANPDTDGDGFSDPDEINLFLTSPLSPNPDSDSDGLPNTVETGSGVYLGPSDTGSSPGDPDSDDDGVRDGEEALHGSNPCDDAIVPVVMKLGEDVRLTMDPHNSKLPSLVWTGSEFGVAWADNREGNYQTYFTRISAGGTEIGDDLRLGMEFSTDSYPSLVFSGSEFGVGWISNMSSTKVYFTRVSAGGTELGEKISWEAAGSPTMDVINALSLASTGSEYGVCWQDSRNGPYEIYFARVSAGGSKLGDEVRLTFGGGVTPSLAWTGSEYGLSYYYGYINFLRISAAGSRIGTDVHVTYYSYSDYNNPSLVWTGSEFGVSWSDTETIFFSRVSAAGDTLGFGISLVEDPSFSGFPSLAWNGSEFGVAWDDDRDVTAEIYFTRISDQGYSIEAPLWWMPTMWSSGQEIGDDMRVTTSAYDSISPSLAWTGSEYGLCWSNEGEIYFNQIGWDRDGDGLGPHFEAAMGLDPEDWDTDDDWLSDYLEAVVSACLDPLNNDTDGDGLQDGSEDLDHDGNLDVGETSPCSPDTEGDGMDDAWESAYACTNPRIPDAAADPDGDGLDNLTEYGFSTDPCDLDTDNDGMDDGWESGYACLDPLTDDADADADGDGLDNLTEYGFATDPCVSSDADGDGMPNDWEDGYACVDSGVGDSLGDPDGDGRTNLQEFNDGTDPCISNLASLLQSQVNYQGRLADSAGVAVGGTVDMAFSLFDGETGGAPLWTEHHQVQVENGIYSVVLGGDTLIPGPAMALPELYLEVSVGGEVLAPRRKITAVLHAINADVIEGRRLEQGYRTLDVSPAAAVSTLHVEFDQPYSSVPFVVVTDLDGLIGGEVFVSTRIYNVAADGFDVEWKSLSGAAASGSAAFGYYAVGQ